VAAALKLLADREQIELRQCGRREVIGGISYYKKGMDITPYLNTGGNFEYRVTPEGRELFDKLRRERFRELGYPAADAIVQGTLEKLSPVMDLDRRDSEFSRHTIRILEELIRIGVRNYQDRFFLRDPAHRFIEQSDAARRDCERGFYQPFLRTELQRDELLAGRIVEGAGMTGGQTDIMAIAGIPLEAKVIYPEDNREESFLRVLGTEQASQYASLSRLAFLSVLDLRPRLSAGELSNIQNDVEVITHLQQGSHPVYIIRVQHICGYGRPSDLK